VFSAPYRQLHAKARQRISTLAVFLWARMGYASRAAKNSPPGCFCPFFCDGAAAVRIHPHENPNFLQTENRQRISTSAFFYGRGWITQAALLKTAHRAVFALSSATAPQLFESTLAALCRSSNKTETPASSQRWSSWWSEAT